MKNREMRGRKHETRFGVLPHWGGATDESVKCICPEECNDNIASDVLNTLYACPHYKHRLTISRAYRQDFLWVNGVPFQSGDSPRWH